MKKVVIYPVDGNTRVRPVLDDIESLFASPVTSQLVRTIKFNSAFHISGHRLLARAQKIVPADVGFFGDFKIADVKQTDIDLLRLYAKYRLDIVTVSACISSQALMAVREVLPDTMIAIVSALTDIPEDEFFFRNRMTPAQRILKDIEDFDQLLKQDNPIGAIISSPRCSPAIRGAFGKRFQNITPGIRSPHMAKDHQEQILSAKQALENGADLLVIGTQLSKGNPNHKEGPITPLQSQQITYDEIKQFFDEQQAVK